MWAVIVASLSLLAAAAQAGIIVSLGSLTDGILAQTSWGSPVAWMIACLLAAAAAEAVSRFGVATWQTAFVRRSYERFGAVLFSDSGSALLRNPRTAALVEGVRSSLDDWMFRDALESVTSIAATWLLGCSALAVLTQWRWWPGFVCALAFLFSSWTVARWSAAVDDELDGTIGDEVRRATYLRTLLTGPEAAMELRVFGLAPHLLQRWRDEWARANRALLRHRRKALGPVLGSTVLLVTAVGGTVVLAISDALSGSIQAGQVVSVMSALLGVTAFGYQGDVMLAVRHTNRTIRDLMALESETTARESERRGSKRNEVAHPRGYELRGSAGWTEGSTALHDLDICLAPGTTNALVGENGAGKSTMAALVTGEIAARGAQPPLRTDPVAAVLQDFGRFPLTLRENIVMGKPFDSQLYERVVDDAGLGVVLSTHPNADVTFLHQDGANLSGGEWQKVALARALYQLNGGPGLLVLDEPSAALDLESESRLFTDVRRYAGEATVLLATHRLGSVRSADRIIVLREGHVVEDGSHSTLMSGSGHYAALARAQSRHPHAPSTRHDAPGDGDLNEEVAP